MDMADPVRDHPASHLREPVVPGREDGEDRAQREHIVEMGDDVVGVVQFLVDRRVGEHDAGDAADGEQEDEADRPDHRGLELDRAAPHRGDP